MTDQAGAHPYDRVPYPSLSYTQSHPDRLATIATLFGLQPPPLNRARVLELGCAGGGNLIPMAYGLPGSAFLGIDISGQQIAQGQETIAALGLSNVRLQQMDILDIDDSLGRFDYILAHGVFSWVSRPVQEKLLAVCRAHLSPDGIAYVSYNAYPGWRMLGIIRDMMLYHTRDEPDPQARAGKARGLLDFLADSIPADQSAYGSFLNTYARFLQGELKGAHQRGDAFLLHDELEEVNDPVYFYQFAERAAKHGLQYLGEADLRTMVDRNFPPQVSEKLRQMARSAIEMEQYMDFLRNRTFRQTLLCHQEVTPTHTLSPDQIAGFTLCSRARPADPDANLADRSIVRFEASDGAVLSTDHPLTKMAMLHMALSWPRGFAVDELIDAARARLAERAAPGAPGDPDPQDALVLSANMLKAYTYSSNLVELHLHEPHLALHVSDRPQASPVARLLARRSATVTNLRHERVDLDEVERLLLLHLDGDHDLDALAGLLSERGARALDPEGELIADPAEARAVMVDSVRRRIGWLARAALLIA